MAYSNRGCAYLAMKNFGNAIADFDNALRINPRNSMALHNRSLAYFQMGEGRSSVASWGRGSAALSQRARLSL